MELVDAVKGFEVGFQDEHGEKVNSELGLVQTSGEQCLCLEIKTLENVWRKIVNSRHHNCEQLCESTNRSHGQGFHKISWDYPRHYQHHQDHHGHHLHHHLGKSNLPLDLMLRVLISLLGMAKPNWENVEPKLSSSLYLAGAWPLRGESVKV